MAVTAMMTVVMTIPCAGEIRVIGASEKAVDAAMQRIEAIVKVCWPCTRSCRCMSSCAYACTILLECVSVILFLLHCVHQVAGVSDV